MKRTFSGGRNMHLRPQLQRVFHVGNESAIRLDNNYLIEALPHIFSTMPERSGEGESGEENVIPPTGRHANEIKLTE